MVGELTVPHECHSVTLDGRSRTVVPSGIFRPVDDIGLLIGGRQE